MRIRTILAVLFVFPLLGCGVIGWGWYDYEDSKTAADEPRAVELADLEGGPVQGNTHVRIGEHAACTTPASTRTTSRAARAPR
jgi:hypothetical protein